MHAGSPGGGLSAGTVAYIGTGQRLHFSPGMLIQPARPGPLTPAAFKGMLKSQLLKDQLQPFTKTSFGAA